MNYIKLMHPKYYEKINKIASSHEEVKDQCPKSEDVNQFCKRMIQVKLKDTDISECILEDLLKLHLKSNYIPGKSPKFGFKHYFKFCIEFGLPEESMVKRIKEIANGKPIFRRTILRENDMKDFEVRGTGNSVCVVKIVKKHSNDILRSNCLMLLSICMMMIILDMICSKINTLLEN